MGDLNTRIFNTLADKKIKAKDMAAFIGTTEGVVSAWKKRGTDPKAIYVKKIAEFLGVSEDYLLIGKEAAKTHLEKEIEELDGVYLSLAKEAQKNEIDPRDIMMAINMIKDIRKNEKK